MRCCRPTASTCTYRIRTSPHHRHALVLLIFELSPCLDLGYLSLSLNPITHLVSSLSDSRHISIASVVHRYLPPVSFHFFWNFDGETDFPRMNHNYFTSFHAHHIHLGLKIPLTESLCLCESPKNHCNPHLWLPGWTFIMAAPTLNKLHTMYFTCAFPILLNFPFLCIQWPLILPPNLLHTTTPKWPPLNPLLPLEPVR